MLNLAITTNRSRSRSIANSEKPPGRNSHSVILTCQPDTATLRAWDELVRKVPGSDVAQLSAWADIRRAAGFEPLYVFAWQSAELIAGALVIWRSLPLVGKVAYVSYGPVIAPDVDREPLIAQLVAALRGIADRQFRTVFVQPPSGADDISLEFLGQGFRPSQAGIAPVASLRLDLAKSEDELFAGLRHEFQEKSRRWARRGVQVRRGTHDDVPTLARLHAATARHHGFPPIPLEYIETLYGRLAPNGHAALFVGEIEGRPLCATLLTGCGGVVTGRLTGMDRDRRTHRLAIPAAVVWAGIIWAKANGYCWFDFGGIREIAASLIDAEQPDLSKLTGSELFKLGFGGTVYCYPLPVEIICSPLVRAAYDLFLRHSVGRRLVERAANSLRAGPRPRQL
jgi:lipid II:glycine glycyltransferase (peptidoglycan interpeptide bridge formation enzyme)